MQDRHTDRERYFKELASTSGAYYMDYVRTQKDFGYGSRILEIGCGEGGNLLPFARAGCDVTGLDLSENRIRQARMFFERAGAEGTFLHRNFLYAETPPEEELFDVILIHDVIEHVEQPHKAAFVMHTKRFLKPDGVIFWAFPAWQMPFGGHQQICRSGICARMPFVHLLPDALYKRLLKACGESDARVEELLSIKKSRMTTEAFERLCRQCGYKIADRTLWLINPHYKEKFHLPAVKLGRAFSAIPYVRNFLSTSCFYLVVPV